MKKTIMIAALALGFTTSAVAESSILDSASYTLSAPVTLEDNYIAPDGVTFSTVDVSREQFTMTTVFTWSAVQSTVTSSVQGAVQIHANDNGKTGFGFYTANGLTVASGMNGNSSYVNSGTTDLSTFVSGDKLVLSMVITNDGGYLYGYNANSNAVVELASNTGWKYGVSGDYNQLWFFNPMGNTVDSVYVYNTKSTTDTVLAISQAAYSAAVPEPATATLSLLALAGLAARRRRS